MRLGAKCKEDTSRRDCLLSRISDLGGKEALTYLCPRSPTNRHTTLFPSNKTIAALSISDVTWSYDIQSWDLLRLGRISPAVASEHGTGHSPNYEGLMKQLMLYGPVDSRATRTGGSSPSAQTVT